PRHPRLSQSISTRDRGFRSHDIVVFLISTSPLLGETDADLHERRPAHLPEPPRASATLAEPPIPGRKPVSDKPEPVIALFDSTLPAEWAARRLTGWTRSDSFVRLESL